MIWEIVATGTMGERFVVPDLLRLLTDEQRNSDLRGRIAETLGELAKSEADIDALAKLLYMQSKGDEEYAALWNISRRTGFRIFVSDDPGGRHIEVSRK